jgi:hypothetical protein
MRMFTLQTKLFNASSINKENWQVDKNKLKKIFYHLKYSDLDFEESEIDKMINEFHHEIGRAINSQLS